MLLSELVTTQNQEVISENMLRVLPTMRERAQDWLLRRTFLGYPMTTIHGTRLTRVQTENRFLDLAKNEVWEFITEVAAKNESATKSELGDVLFFLLLPFLSGSAIDLSTSLNHTELLNTDPVLSPHENHLRLPLLFLKLGRSINYDDWNVYSKVAAVDLSLIYFTIFSITETSGWHIEEIFEETLAKNTYNFPIPLFTVTLSPFHDQTEIITFARQLRKNHLLPKFYSDFEGQDWFSKTSRQELYAWVKMTGEAIGNYSKYLSIRPPSY